MGVDLGGENGEEVFEEGEEGWVVECLFVGVIGVLVLERE